MMTTAELLRQPAASCSCCGGSQYPGTALVYTDNDNRVEWVLCKACTSVCDRLANGAGQVECGFEVCGREW